MKRIVVYLLVLHTALSINETIKLKRKLIIPKLDDDCKKVKCPAVEEPICVKMKYKNPEKSTKTIYIVMLNKCEMGYMKCHKGLEAHIVAMKNCAHEGQMTSGKKTLMRSKREIKSGDVKAATARKRSKVVKLIRNKRKQKTRLRNDKGSRNITETRRPTRLGSEYEDPHSNETDDIDAEFRVHDFDPLPQDDSDQNRNDERPTFQGTSSKLTQTEQSSVESAGPKIVSIKSAEAGKPMFSHYKMFEKSPFTSTEQKNEGINQRLKLIGSINPKVGFHDDVNNMPDGASEAGEYGNANIDKSRQDTDSNNNSKATVMTDVSLEDGEDGIFKEAEPVDINENEAQCPAACPARTVMVCGRCQHDVYKTFMSICHMRMFACHHTDEILELVSRYPCVMSAPYLSVELPMQPRGILSEPADDDRILRYIHCREQGKLITDQNQLAKIKMIDPKCDFKQDSKLKHEAYFSDILDYY